jgi:hypothetical protein
LPDPNPDILELIDRIKGPKAEPSQPVARIEIEQEVGSNLILLIALSLLYDPQTADFLTNSVKSVLLELPAEITSHIFDFLEPSQLFGTGLVCRSLHDFADDPWVVRFLFCFVFRTFLVSSTIKLTKLAGLMCSKVAFYLHGAVPIRWRRCRKQ